MGYEKVVGEGVTGPGGSVGSDGGIQRGDGGKDMEGESEGVAGKQIME